MIKKFISSVTLVAMVLMTSGILNPFVATAASITTATAVFGRLKQSVPAESVVLTFGSPTGIQTGGADTITLTFSSDFTLAAESVTNFDIGLGNSATCSSATYTDETIALTASATEWGIDVNTGTNIITLSPETDDILTAGYCIRVEMGTAATTGGTGSASTITNGPLDDDDTIVVGGVFADTGTITLEILDDDQVSVSATVNQTMSFDLDVGYTTGENGTPYQVPLGTLSSGSVSVSNGSSIKTIYADGGTNSSGGMNVSVRNANGANGLASTAVPADKIPSATGTMVAGTANYGLCAATAALTGFSRSAGYTTTCAISSGTNGVVGLTTTAADVLTSSAPVASGHAEIVVNAAISTATPAHADYTDTLTFIATASF
jgi:hypothetical protein